MAVTAIAVPAFALAKVPACNKVTLAMSGASTPVRVPPDRLAVVELSYVFEDTEVLATFKLRGLTVFVDAT